MESQHASTVFISYRIPHEQVQSELGGDVPFDDLRHPGDDGELEVEYIGSDLGLDHLLQGQGGEDTLRHPVHALQDLLHGLPLGQSISEAAVAGERAEACAEGVAHAGQAPEGLRIGSEELTHAAHLRAAARYQRRHGVHAYVVQSYMYVLGKALQRQSLTFDYLTHENVRNVLE